MRRANGDASRLGAVGLTLLATALLAGRLAEGDLIGDPVIYAAVAKSMLVRGEWATQYLAGQPFFDKPPLVAWLAALAFELFGVAFLGKGALALGAPAVLATYWLATPGDRRPPLGALVVAALAFLAVVLPWHLYETWVWGWRFVHGYLSDVSEKMGGHPGAAVYARALVVTTLPWLPLAAVGAWRSWRSGERGDGLRLLTVWTLVAYGFLFAAAKHSPRYLVLLHPALALWAALALRPLLPAARALGLWVAAAAGLAWAVILLWPHPLHPGGTCAAVTALAPVRGPREAPLAGLRLQHEGARARLAVYAARAGVRPVGEPAAVVGVGSRTPAETMAPSASSSTPSRAARRKSLKAQFTSRTGRRRRARTRRFQAAAFSRRASGSERAWR